MPISVKHRYIIFFIFRDRGTGVSAIAHFDEFTKRVHFEKMAASFLEKIRQIIQA